jgi:hypothetical protein
MKKAIAVLMLLFTFVQSTSQLWIAVSFFANRAYIAKVLCVNRDKPKMDCNGACQLKKNIEKDKESQEKSGIDNKVKEVLVYFPSSLLQVQPDVIFDWNEKPFRNTFFSAFFPDGLIHSIFHPPACIV